MKIVDYLTIGAAGVIYFRAMLTSNRDFDTWKEFVGIELAAEIEWANSTRARGPIPIFDPRVIALTLLILLPMLLYPSLKQHEIYGFILCIGIGAFISPLLIPTASEPSPNDLSTPGTLMTKWLIGKLDVYVKTSVAGLVVAVMNEVPLIGYWLSKIASTAFPIVRETGIEAAIIDASACVLLGMFVIRVMMFVSHGYAYAMLVGMSTSWIWIEYQFFFDKEIGNGEQSVLPSFSKMLVLIILSDLMLSILNAAINATVPRSNADGRSWAVRKSKLLQHAGKPRNIRLDCGFCPYGEGTADRDEGMSAKCRSRFVFSFEQANRCPSLSAAAKARFRTDRAFCVSPRRCRSTA